MQVNMHEAKTHLSKLVQAVLDGEQVILARNGEAVVQITKYTPVKHKRKPGSLKGKIWLADDWDSPETNRMINEMMMKTRIFPDEPDPHAVNEPTPPYEVTARTASVAARLASSPAAEKKRSGIRVGKRVAKRKS